MTDLRDDADAAEPVSALRHRGLAGRRDIDAVTLLTIYLVLLFAIPSNLTVSALGSLGRPSLIWGLILIVFWTISALQRRAYDVRPVRQPIQFVFACFFVLALVSFAAALLRGQPGDQVSPAFTALVRLLSWGGVVLVAIAGIRTMNDMGRMMRRVVIGAGLLAALGIAQFLTGQTLLDFFSFIPGVSNTGGGVLVRGGVTRSSGTAIHPLEYATTLIGVFPLAIAGAISHGFTWEKARSQLRWWIPVVLISVSALVGVSRSAIVGFVLAAAAMVPAIPRRYRAAVVTAGVVLGAVVIAALPGLLSTTLALFSGAGADPSAQSRVGGLDKAPGFIEASPIIGVGWGTFLPRYYIFDNQWVLIAVELGVLGVLVFGALLFSSVWSAGLAARQAAHGDLRLVGYALAVSVVVIGVMFAFFDGLSFPISAGTLFLVIGLCGSARNIGVADSLWVTSPGSAVKRVPEATATPRRPADSPAGPGDRRRSGVTPSRRRATAGRGAGGAGSAG
jgi:hypothetical protein